MEGPPTGLPHLLGKALQPHQLAQPFLDGQLEVRSRVRSTSFL